jgi:hypothetical protein
MDFFTHVDTLSTASYLYNPITPSGSFTEHQILPVTELELGGQAITSKGFGSVYGLYLTFDGAGMETANGPIFGAQNVTLWADLKNDDGAVSATAAGGAAFANSTADDIVLATGTMKSASVAFDPATMTRHANFIDMMTPTLAGTVLLNHSITPGSLLETKLTTPPAAYQALPQADGSSIDLVNGATGQVTLASPGDTGMQTDFLLPKIPSGLLQLAHRPNFIHHDRC